MSKDEQIAWFMARVEFLEAELAAERARRPMTPAERQRQKRERDIVSRNGHANVTTSVTGGTIGGSNPVVPEVEVQGKEGNDPSPNGESPERGAVTTTVTNDGFDAFWAVYPKNHGAKHIAKRRWAGLSQKDRDEAMVGAKHYAASQQVASGHVKYVEAWISERRWEAWQEPEVVLSGNGNGHAPLGRAQAAIAAWSAAREPQENYIEGEVIR